MSTHRAQTFAKTKISIVVHAGFSRRKHIVSWFDLETCSKVIEEDDAVGQKTYDLTLVFYSVILAVSLTVSVLQSTLYRNDFVSDTTEG